MQGCNLAKDNAPITMSWKKKKSCEQKRLPECLFALIILNPVKRGLKETESILYTNDFIKMKQCLMGLAKANMIFFFDDFSGWIKHSLLLIQGK